MDFGGSFFAKSPRAALAGALASVALVFALLAADAEAELITPETATAPPVTVPQAANAAPPPAAQAPPSAPSAPAPSEPAFSPEPSQAATDAGPILGSTGIDGDGHFLADPVSGRTLRDTIIDFGVAVDHLVAEARNLMTLDKALGEAKAEAGDLIERIREVEKSLQDLRDVIQAGTQKPASPPGTADTSTEQPGGSGKTDGDGGEQTADGSSGGGGNGGGGSGGNGGKDPDGDPTQAVD